jgi:predicted acyl esterase
MKHAWLALVLLAACAPDGNARFQVRESVEQLYITYAEHGAQLELDDSQGNLVQSGVADELGSLVFRKVPPGSGYVVRTVGAVLEERSRHLTVMSVASSQPDGSFYRKQKLQPGFNYLTMRDGTTLSAYVTLPGPPEMGPYPTVVSYSGYDPSRPGEPIGDYSYLCDTKPVFCDAPTDPSALIAAMFDYATVGVNVRGTGCSGGAYDFFETLQLLDGYDVVETVAAQDWVANHQVGMVGLSYPGITQMFVAATQPPSLAAITPLSVIGNTATTLTPGGILNDGFALTWVSEVLDKAQPYGQGWEQGRVDGGDTTCGENQLLHGQLVDNVAQAKSMLYYDPSVDDRYNPSTFVDQVKVPVFLAGAWQDEQTGPYFFTLLNKFSSSPALRFTVYNGVHPDGFQPDVLADWHSFLDLFVAQKLPVEDRLIRDLSPILFQQVFKSNQRLPTSQWTSYGSYDDALAAWQAAPPVRAIFESGAGDASEPGAPKGTFEHAFASWPPPETQAQRWYLHGNGQLRDEPPTEANQAASFDLDPDAGERGNLAPDGNVWDLLPHYDWRPPASGKAVVFESDKLGADGVMMGTASVDLWLKSTVNDADLQATLTEVRPDGQEMYVQSGWLRASNHGLSSDSTQLFPSPTLLQSDAVPLAPGQWTEVRVGIAAFGHVFRAGSRIRLIVDTPGGSRASWRFALKTFPGGATHTIGHDAEHPSSLALPVLMGVSAPSPLPACPSLRGQPCRPWAPFQNRTAD